MSYCGVETSRGVRNAIRDKIDVIYIIIFKAMHLLSHKTILTAVT